jgi:hypothetical protein
MANILLIIASILFIVTFGIHATIMSGDPLRRPAYTGHPIFRHIPAIIAFVLPVIAWSKIIDIHWIWLFILNFLFGFIVSRWLTNGFLTRFASGKGLGKDILVAFVAGAIAFTIGLAIHNDKDKLYDSSNHTNSRYKYEHRTGTTGNYTYNYDVSGTDENGNSVSGNIDMKGKYGSGTITEEDGNEIEVEVEWVGSGQLTATDDDGNTYDLEVD